MLRSAAYYRGEEGRIKKRTLNRKRYLVTQQEEVEPQAAQMGPEDGKGPEPIIVYVRMVTSLIEGREVSFDEIEEMLAKISRQRSLTRRSKLDYVVEQLNKDPP